jgi:hypothetical protein
MDKLALKKKKKTTGRTHACNLTDSRIRRIIVRSHPGQIVHKTLSQKIPSQQKGLVEWLKV